MLGLFFDFDIGNNQKIFLPRDRRIKKRLARGVGVYNIYTVVITQQRMEFWWA
jgi:hypothetical protein